MGAKCKTKEGKAVRGEKKILDNVGFAWQRGRGRPSIAETMLAELETFKSEHGHCNVNLKLGSLSEWVKNVRHRQKKEKLSEEVTDVLDNMGFTWAKS